MIFFSDVLVNLGIMRGCFGSKQTTTRPFTQFIFLSPVEEYFLHLVIFKSRFGDSSGVFSSVNFSRSRMVVSTMTWIMIHKKYESSEKSEKLPERATKVDVRLGKAANAQ